MAYRLIAVTPAIKAHPYWISSIEEGMFQFGGVQLDHVKDMIARKERCTDLTAGEQQWVRLWREAIKEYS